MANHKLRRLGQVKKVRIRCYSGLYFPVFGLNMERYSVSLRIQYKCGKIRTRITPNTDTFNPVLDAPGKLFYKQRRDKKGGEI